jgi:hypothetical protein
MGDRQISHIFLIFQYKSVTESPKPSPKLDPVVIDRIKLRAKQEGISVAEVVEKAIYFYLDNPNMYVKNTEIDDRIAQAIAPIQREVAMLRAELSEYGQLEGVDRPSYKSQRLVREMFND